MLVNKKIIFVRLFYFRIVTDLFQTLLIVYVFFSKFYIVLLYVHSMLHFICTNCALDDHCNK